LWTHRAAWRRSVDGIVRKAMALMMIKDKHKIAIAALPAALLLAYVPHTVKILAIG